MKSRIATVLVVLALTGASGAVSAQSRYDNSANARASSTTARSRATTTRVDTGSRSTAAPLSRGPVSRTAATKSSLTRPSATGRRGAVAPMMSASEQRFMSSAISRVLSARPGSVAAPRGATHTTMQTLFRGAWSKMMTGGRDVRMLDVHEERGTRRTYWVNMNQPTGRTTYPPHVRGIPQTFRHVVIQYWSSPRGVFQMRMLEPGGPAPRNATAVPRRAY